MSSVRVLVGTRKGAFVLTSDGDRQDWEVAGPHFGGWEIYHVAGSPADPDRLYASQSNAWFGQLIQRSDDGGKTWQPVGNEFKYDGVPGTHQWYDGTPHPWEFARVWHLEPSLGDPDTVYAGVEDAGLFSSTDGGQSWHELSGLRRHDSGSAWQPGAGGRACTPSSTCTPTSPTPSMSCRSRATPSTTRPREAAGVPQPDGGRRMAAARKRPTPAGLLRQRAARRHGRRLARACGVYFGTTGGQVYSSADAGDRWEPIVRDLPAVLSVEVQTLP